MISAKRAGSWTPRLRHFIVITALFVFALDISGCSKKDETSAVPTKAPIEKAAGVSPHQMPPSARQSNPDTERFNKGLKLSLQGKYDEAIKEYKLVLKTRPDSSEAYNNIGFAYYDKKDMEKAIENHGKALEINPDLANGYFGLALAYEKKGDKMKALANWKEFTKRADPKSKWHKKAMGHIQELTMSTNTKQKTH